MWATVATTCKYPFTSLLFYFTVILSFTLLSLIILFHPCFFFFLLFSFLLAIHVLYELFDTDMLPYTHLWPTVTKILKYDFLLSTHKLFWKSIPMVATPNKQLKNICVLSGFNYGKHKAFVEVAIDFGWSIAERKLHVVYEGGNQGLSKLVSKATFVRGSQVLRIILKALKSLSSLSDSPTGEELVVWGMQERITEMLNHADALIFLSGDLATLEALITLAS